MGSTITIFAFGGTGDIRPLAALGGGLVRRGFTVAMLTPARFGHLAERAGLELIPLDVDPIEMLESDLGKEWLTSRNSVRLVRGLREIIAPMAESMFEELLASTARADALLAPVSLFAAGDAAEYLGIPYGVVHLQPGEPTRTAANPLVAAGRSLGPVLNRASYTLVEQITWQIFRGMSNRRRTQRLDLPPTGLRGPFHRARAARVPVFCGFSEAVVPRPADWPESVHQTGYWFLDEPPSAVDPALAAFVSAGPPPVYIGFGSMVPTDPDRTRDDIRSALALAGVRGVVLGSPDEPTQLISETVLQVPSAPHEWLFSRCAAVVHHGGAGTTAAALRAGVPSVICPFFSDQPFWAARVAALGAGPAALPIKQLAAPRLADRITTAIHDPGIRANAKAIARRLSTENGVGTAAGLIEQWLADPGAAGAPVHPALAQRHTA